MLRRPSLTPATNSLEDTDTTRRRNFWLDSPDPDRLPPLSVPPTPSSSSSLPRLSVSNSRRQLPAPPPRPNGNVISRFFNRVTSRFQASPPTMSGSSKKSKKKGTPSEGSDADLLNNELQPRLPASPDSCFFSSDSLPARPSADHPDVSLHSSTNTRTPSPNGSNLSLSSASLPPIEDARPGLHEIPSRESSRRGLFDRFRLRGRSPRPPPQAETNSIRISQNLHEVRPNVFESTLRRRHLPSIPPRSSYSSALDVPRPLPADNSMSNFEPLMEPETPILSNSLIRQRPDPFLHSERSVRFNLSGEGDSLRLEINMPRLPRRRHANEPHTLPRDEEDESFSLRRVLEGLRNGIGESIAMSLLHQREVEGAEQELGRLNRIKEIEELSLALGELEAEYHSLPKSPVPNLSDPVARELLDRMATTRLLMQIREMTNELMGLQTRGFGASPPEALQATVNQLVDLMGRFGEDEVLRETLMAEEARLALVYTPSSPPSPPPLYSSIAYRLKFQETQLKFLKEHKMGKAEVTIRREHLVEDSRRVISRSPIADLHRRLYVQFEGEDGKDFGGLAREWLADLSRLLVDEQPSLFCPAPFLNGYSIVPWPEVGKKELEDYEFLGVVLSLATFHNKLIDVQFPPFLFKLLLGGEMMLGDIAELDPDYHAQLKAMLSADDSDALGLSFTVVYRNPATGTPCEFPLKPQGADCAVTDANKQEYVDLVVSHYQSSISKQMEALRQGFFLHVRPEYVRNYTPEELALLVCGVQALSLDEWKRRCVYENGYTASSPQVRWFWEVLEGYPEAMRQRVLQFTTGSSRLPVGGFDGLHGVRGPAPFTLYRCGDRHCLPAAHTCFNRLDLPEYESRQELQKKLDLSLQEGGGFNLE